MEDFIASVKEAAHQLVSVEGAVEGDLKRLKSAREVLAAAKRDQKIREGRDATMLLKAKEEVEALRESFRTSLAPSVERYNELSVSENFYKQVIDTVGDGYRYTNALLKSELKQYGYLSKRLFSYTLNLSAFFDRLRGGKPFYHEMQGLQEPPTGGPPLDSLPVWGDTLRHFSFKGMPQYSDFYAAALELAQAAQDVRHYQVEVLAVPQSLFDYLKVPVLGGQRLKVDTIPDYKSKILDSTDALDLDRSLQLADEAAKSLSLESYKSSPLDARSTEPTIVHIAADGDTGGKPVQRASPAAAYHRFREIAIGLKVSQQYEAYSAAVLSLQQYKMTEMIFREL